MPEFMTNAVEQDRCFLQFPSLSCSNLLTVFANFFEKPTPVIRTSTSGK